MEFNKPATSYDEQIDLLRARGLIINDEVRARHFLSHINYYRLTGYWLPFEANHATHQFKPEVTIDDVLNLYIFDREFRLLVMDAIERVEVSLRAQWAYTMAHQYGAHAYLDASLASVPKIHARNLAKLEDEISRSSEIFIDHYQQRYQRPATPPIWSVSEIMSLGMLSSWIALMVPSDRKMVAKVYGLDQGLLKKFVHHLTYVRNLCAHHSRLWNRSLTFTMTLPKTKPKTWLSSFNPTEKRKIYNTLVMLAGMMDQINPNHHWKQRLVALIAQHNIDVAAMGFPSDWQQRPIWSGNAVKSNGQK